MFLIRPLLRNDEHILNYLLRISISNGFKNTIQLLRCIDFTLINNRLPTNKIAFGDFSTKLLLKNTNLKIDSVSSPFFHSIKSNYYKFNQFIVPSSSINFYKPTFCPQCFYGELKHSIQHFLLPVTHCIKHQCILIDINPFNGQCLTWSTANLQQIMKEVSTTAEEMIPTVTKNINRLALDPSEQLLVGTVSFDLSNYLVLLQFFSRYHQRNFTNQTKQAKQLSNEQRVNLYNTANEHLHNWPTGFYALLNSFIIKPMAQRGTTGIRHYFRDLYDEIYSGIKQKVPAYQFLMEAFEYYLQYEFSESAFINSFTRIKAPLHISAAWLSESSTAKLLGIPVSHLKLFVNAGLLKQYKNGTLLKKDIDEFALKAKDHITLKEVTHLLDIGKCQVLQLVEAGLLKSIIQPDDKLRDWLFDMQAVQELVILLKSKTTDQKALSTSLKSSTFKALTFKGFCISTVIKNILNDKIAMVYFENLNNLFSLQQFHPYLDLSFQPNEYVSPKQVSENLEVNINAIYDFVKRGFLLGSKKQVGRTSRKVMLIHQSSINNFKDHYYLKSNINKSEKQNYRLVSGPKEGGGLVNLYVKN